jgi:hypothetical protein
MSNLLFVVNTTIELQNITITYDNTITLLSQNITRWKSLLLDAVVKFWSSIVILTRNGQLLDCATIAVSVSIVVNPPQNANIYFNQQSITEAHST